MGKGMSSNPSDWGVYGDFIGGSINPLLTIVNIIALVYLTYIVSHIEENRAQESINAQKIITLTQMRYNAASELTKDLDDIFSAKQMADVAKPLDKLLLKTIVFEKNSDFLFGKLYTEEFKNKYFRELEGSIQAMIDYNDRGFVNSAEEFKLSIRYGAAQRALIMEVNKFIIEEMGL